MRSLLLHDYSKHCGRGEAVVVSHVGPEFPFNAQRIQTLQNCMRVARVKRFSLILSPKATLQEKMQLLLVKMRKNKVNI